MHATKTSNLLGLVNITAREAVMKWVGSHPSLSSSPIACVSCCLHTSSTASLHPYGFPFLSPVLLEFPVAIIQWTHLPSLQPAGDAVEMECVLTQMLAYTFELSETETLTLHIPQATVHSSLVAEA